MMQSQDGLTRGQWPSTQVFLLDRVSESTEDPAWQEFADLYMPIVQRFCRRRGLQNADAEEVTQNVFANVVEAMPKFRYDPDRGRFRSWLCTIACHEVMRFRAKSRRQVTASGSVPGDSLYDATCSEIQAVWSESFYEGIYETAGRRVRPLFDATTWQAFHLTWERHVPTPEVARLLGKSTNWVYKAKFRVQKTLRAAVLHLAADEPTLNR